MISAYFILASEGDHEGRPYKNHRLLGAGLVPALARSTIGTQAKTEVNP
jgi:hypothetical protein